MPGLGGLVEVLEAARQWGFLGPGPVEGHLAHAEGFAAAVPAPPGRAADLGTGGGVPGLVLAFTWPASRWTFVESQHRRAAFLVDAVGRLQLGDRVTVLEDRAEVAGRDAGHRGTYDLVTARSFGPPAVTAECAAPLLRTDGLLVVSEPPAAGGRWDAPGLAVLGLELADVVQPTARYAVLQQVRTCPETYPRRVGVPRKRPLF